jgi:hypothetical protein
MPAPFQRFPGETVASVFRRAYGGTMTTDAIGAKPEPLRFCTIVSKNFIAQVRALAESLRAHHPDSPFHR